MAGQERGHEEKERKAGRNPGLSHFVIASEAKQSIAMEALWIASSLRSSQ
jgi:hypothetical protein